jgi:hypothetical protein
MKDIVYKTVVNGSPYQLDKQINDLLQIGWELFCNPYAIRDANNEPFSCQALVYSEKEDK